MASEDKSPDPTTAADCAAPASQSPLDPLGVAVSVPPAAAAGGADDDADTPIVDVPSYIPGLSPRQEKALATLLEGKSAVEAAVMAGVNRATIYRWQRHSPKFAAAFNLCRRQKRDEFAARMSAMQEKALAAVSELLDKKDFRVIKLVFSFLEKQRIGPGTPEGVVRHLARPHEQRAEAALARMIKAGFLPIKIREQLADEYFKGDDARKKLEARPAQPGKGLP